MVDEFNENKDIKVFLISLKAGGTGLNLTGADMVIHYDPWWNASAENQATDRAYRIGQKNNVQVYKLIMKNSIEEKIQKLQEQKQDLSNHIIKIINSQKKESQIIKNISNKYLENIEKIKLISKSDSKQFFIIINQPQENNKEEICIDQLNEKYLKIKEGLLRCGNIVTNVNNEKETKEIIRNYIFLNDDENRM